MKMLVFWITVLITLGGCASIDRFQVATDCDAVKKAAEAKVASCGTAIGSTPESCAAILVPSCVPEWEAVERHDRAVERRAAERNNNCPGDLVEVCTRNGCGCLSNTVLRGIFR